MSKYTTKVCDIINDLCKNTSYTTIKDKVNYARTKIFDFDYTLWNSNYKSVLENKILKHYYLREIGFETVEMWKFKLDVLLNELLPEINKLYETTQIEYNPIFNYEMNETVTKSNNGTASTESNNESNSESNADSRYHDTPAGLLDSNLDEYATSISKGKDLTNTSDVNTSNQTMTNTEDFIRSISGVTGTNKTELIIKYREAILNIDLILINKLNELFMNLW